MPGPDTSPGFPSCEGDWSGVYEHVDPPIPAGRHPISAAIRLRGRRLEGTMNDGDTVLRLAPDEIRGVAEGYSDVGRSQVADLLDRHPDLTIETRMHPVSRLSGRVDDDRVRFTKTYGGPKTVRHVTASGTLVTRSWPAHAVQYDGRLDPSGREINGQWSIRRGLLRYVLAPIAHGTFRLERATSA